MSRRAGPASHRCHAVGCSTPVPPRLLMCAAHWRMLPRELQADVWATYRPGQEVTKDPSEDYLLAQTNAVIHVAKREGRPFAEWGDKAVLGLMLAYDLGDEATRAELRPLLEKLRRKVNAAAPPPQEIGQWF